MRFGWTAYIVPFLFVFSPVMLLDGESVKSCTVLAVQADGQEIITIEGLAQDGELHPLQQAFHEHHGLQCGYCTPGMILAADSLIREHPEGLTDEQVRLGLEGNLCRCTGYTKILDAIELLASGEVARAEPIKGVGSRGCRYEGGELSLGERGFVDDLRPPGLLHGFFRLADHARADVERIDTSKAGAMPGVVRVLTAADVPGKLRVGLIHKDWPVFIPEGGRTSYLGDVLAMVVADTREQARAAADAVEITYAPLRPITDALAAIDDPDDAVWGLEGNVLSRSAYRRGDVDAALAAAIFTYDLTGSPFDVAIVTDKDPDGLDVVRDVGRVRPLVNMIAGGERSLYARLTGRENLWYFAQLYDIPAADVQQRIASLLELVAKSLRIEGKEEEDAQARCIHWMDIH